MTTITSNQQSPANPDLSRKITRRIVQVFLVVLIQAAVLFLLSWDFRWLGAWFYMGIYLGMLVVNAFILLRRSPEMVAERAQVGEGAKGWDKIIGTIMMMFGSLGMLVISALDRRFGWSPSLGLGVQIAGAALYVLGFVWFMWAMASNRFFSTIVRIQKDRGHTVETGGPYRFVRHPAYASMLWSSLGTVLLLGSLWALIPLGVFITLNVVRTALEDRTLRTELPGYEAYAQRVRYRLLPGVW